jgi:hypothetical protein
LTTGLIRNEQFDVGREALNVVENLLVRSKLAARAEIIELQREIFIQYR